MSVASTSPVPEAQPIPFVPSISREELARRNAEVVAFLDALADDVESEQDQRETWEVLRRALGEERVASSRPAILP
jgi:hypothetical protein